MDTKTAIRQLEQEWDIRGGFFGQARYHTFDPAGLERVIHILESLEVQNADCLDRRLVSLLWFAPIFLEWQKDSFHRAGKSTCELDSAIDLLLPFLYNILGVP